EPTGNDHTAFLHHLDFHRSPDGHLVISAGDPQVRSSHLAQEPLEHGYGGAGADGSIGAAEDVGKIVPLGSDSHRGCPFFSSYLIDLSKFVAVVGPVDCG